VREWASKGALRRAIALTEAIYAETKNIAERKISIPNQRGCDVASKLGPFR
jgi:hypothetical protein